MSVIFDENDRIDVIYNQPEQLYSAVIFFIFGILSYAGAVMFGDLQSPEKFTLPFIAVAPGTVLLQSARRYRTIIDKQTVTITSKRYFGTKTIHDQYMTSTISEVAYSEWGWTLGEWSPGSKISLTIGGKEMTLLRQQKFPIPFSDKSSMPLRLEADSIAKYLDTPLSIK